MTFFQENDKLFLPETFAVEIIAALDSDAVTGDIIDNFDGLLTATFAELSPSRVSSIMKHSVIAAFLKDTPHKDALRQYKVMKDDNCTFSHYKAAWLISEELRYMTDVTVHMTHILSVMLADIDARDAIVTNILTQDHILRGFNEPYRTLFFELTKTGL